jgi:hypothetical protein
MDGKIMKKEFASKGASTVRILGGKFFFFMIFSSIGGASVQFEYKILTLAA